MPKASGHSKALSEALRYSVLGGGKRIRPILVLASCEAAGGDPKKAMSAACAIELIHSYSLVHDDLPCMDNDDERRGKPSCHKKFGEATALLAGDALLTLAFQILAMNASKNSATDAKRCLEASGIIAYSAGISGMVGGQAIDLEFQGKEADLPTLDYIHTHKTGALIAASTRVGAHLAGASPQKIEALFQYGKSLGLLFQIIDDLLDGDGYAKIVGTSETRENAQVHLKNAKKHLKIFGSKANRLLEIADAVYERKN